MRNKKYVFIASVITIMIIIFIIVMFISRSSPMYQSEEEMKKAFNGSVYTCYEDDAAKAQITFSDDRFTEHTFSSVYFGDSEYTFYIKEWDYRSGVIKLYGDKIKVLENNAIEYDDRIYELGDIKEEYLNGNPFFDAKDTDRVDGDMLVRIIYMSKEDAKNAGQEAYQEFIDQYLDKLPSVYKGYDYHGVYEMVIINFGDGTGIIYYGCVPSNNMYGKLSGYEIVEPYGSIIYMDSGLYEYHSWDDF